MASIPPKAREAMDLAKSGDLVRAIRSGEQAVAETPDNPGLLLFLASLHSRRLDLRAALPHLRRAAALVPGDPLPRLELARALASVGELDEAERMLDGIDPARGQSVGCLRVRALILQRRGAHRDAARLYGIATERDPADFESWAQLGICLLAIGQPNPAERALRRSLELRPHQPAVLVKLAEAQAASGQAEKGLRAARAMARALPYDPLVRVAIARLEDLIGRPALAEEALQDALALDPQCAPALLALADLRERDNDLDALEHLIARLDGLSIPPAETELLRARLLYRRGDFEAALSAAEAAPASAGAGARAFLLGRIRDRLGDHDGAFAAFAEMNRLTALEASGAKEMAAEYRAMVASRTRLVARAGHGGRRSHPTR